MNKGSVSVWIHCISAQGGASTCWPQKELQRTLIPVLHWSLGQAQSVKFIMLDCPL